MPGSTTLQPPASWERPCPARQSGAAGRNGAARGGIPSAADSQNSVAGRK
jgi:hypothetical protein